MKKSILWIIPTMLSIVFLYTGIREKLCSRKSALIFSIGMSMGTAITFTRGTKISSTSASSNSIALEISSRSCMSREPSSCASSTMDKSSYSVILSSFFDLNILRRRNFSPANKIVMGYRMTIIARIG